MRNFIRLIAPYFLSEQKKYARWGLFLLVLLSQCSTSFGYFFIQWNRRFYDALETRNTELFIRECYVFAAIAVSFVVIYSLTKYFSQHYALKWRLWMTKTALNTWTSHENRGVLEGSDQRIQEDLMRFTLLFERFFLDCFNAVLLIIWFIPLLFTQTSNLLIGNFHLGWVLLVVAICYTAIGMIVSAKIANHLIQLEYDNQKLEAEFRYHLVHVKDGKNVSNTFFDKLLVGITGNYNRIYLRQRSFNIWQRSYNQFSFLIPFALLGTNYFAGLLTLGMLMQIKSTFSRIRNSMAYLLDHYTELTEMIAIAKRLVEFYASVNIPHFNLEQLQGGTLEPAS